MKRLFVSELDTPLGRQICEKFGKLREYDIVGTVRDPDSLANGLPPYVKSICSSYRDDNVEFKAQVLDSDVIVCPLRDDVTEAGAAIRMLSTTAYDVEKTFVLVSSVLTWANTHVAQKAEEAAERAAERQALIDAGEEPPEEDGEPAEPEEAPTFTDDQYTKRIPHQRYQHWRDLETMTKQVNSETLHTYVVFAGLAYGNGEDILHPLFRAAWHHRPLPLYTAGANVVPMIHVSDLANIVMKLGNSNDTLPQRYFLAVDRGNHTLSQIVRAINEQMGTRETFAVPESQHGAVRFVEHFTVDLRFEPSNVFEVHEEGDWAAADGFVAAIEKVCDEFRVGRGVQPVRCVVLGAPHAGKTTLAAAVAAEYRVNHLTIADIIADYERNVADLEERLRGLRAAKRAERRRAARDEKKRLAREAAEAAAAEAAEAAEVAQAAAGKGGAGDAADEEDEDGDGGAPTSARAAAAAAAAAANEEMAATADDEFEVEFDVETPPGGGGGDDGSGGGEDGAEGGGEGDAAGAKSGGPAGGDGGEGGVDEGADDDEEDEALTKLKEELAAARRVLKLRIQVSGPRPKRRDEEGEEGNDEGANDNSGDAADNAEQDDEGNSGASASGAVAKFRFIDEALATMVRWKLTRPECRNEGYVLDGFPKSVRQAALAFIAGGEVPLPELDENGEPPAPDASAEEDAGALMAAVDDKLLPELCFVVNTEESVLKTRVDEADPHRTLANFYRRLLRYKAAHSPAGRPHQSLVAWFRAILTNREGQPPRDATVVPLDGNPSASGFAEMLEAVRREIGSPRFYRPTPEELVEAARRVALDEERRALKAIREQEAAELAAAQAEEARRKAAANHQRRYTSIEAEQAAARDMRALPMQRYLMQFVVPAVTRAMQHTVALRPEDPVDALADALFHYRTKTEL